MFFYSRLTRRKKGPPLVSHQAREHAAGRFKEFFGKKLGLGRAAQHEVRGRDSEARRRMYLHNREEIIKELDELKKLFDSIILHVREPKARERVAKIFELVYEGIEGGGIRSLDDVKYFFAEFFREKERPPEEQEVIQKLMQNFKSPGEAAEAYTRGFERFFLLGTKQTKKLDERFFELARIARQ